MAQANEQTYVVQMLSHEGSEDYEGWQDIATVTVPGRTHRKTVIEKALKASGVMPKPGEQMRVRVLDADSAEVTLVGSVQPPAQLVIGGTGEAGDVG